MLLGKTATAIALAKKYEAAILTVDQVILDAISSGNTTAGLRAREMCQEAARKRAEELKLMEGEEAEKKPGGLSVEQLTAHTQVTSKSNLQTQFISHSNHKIKLISESTSKYNYSERQTSIINSLSLSNYFCKLKIKMVFINIKLVE